VDQEKMIIVVGMECQDLEVIELVKNCDLVYARGALASQWLAELYEKDVIQVGSNGLLLDTWSIGNWFEQIQAAIDSNKKVAYVTSISPVMIDHFVNQLVRQFGLPIIESFQGALTLLVEFTATGLYRFGTNLFAWMDSRSKVYIIHHFRQLRM